jgi:hypothetical protein
MPRYQLHTSPSNALVCTFVCTSFCACVIHFAKEDVVLHKRRGRRTPTLIRLNQKLARAIVTLVPNTELKYELWSLAQGKVKLVAERDRAPELKGCQIKPSITDERVQDVLLLSFLLLALTPFAAPFLTLQHARHIVGVVIHPLTVRAQRRVQRALPHGRRVTTG